MSELAPNIEQLILPAQFGVRFLDSALGQFVSAGLQVQLWPAQQPERAYAATANRAGVFVAHPMPTPAPPQPEPATLWEIEVRDTQARFLPLRFRCELPNDQLTQTEFFSPPFAYDLPFGGIPLFSAAARSLPAGMAALRADLTTRDGAPASWAFAVVVLVERTGEIGQTLGWGVADQRGHLFVPIKPLLRSAATGPDQPWTMRLFLYCDLSAPAPTVPLLETLLSQPPVLALATLSPSQPLGDLSVQAGQTVVVRTAGISELILSD